MEKNNVRRVKIVAAGISDSGGAVRTCVNLTKAAGALVRLDPVPCMPSAEPAEGDGTTTWPSGITRAAAHYEPVRLTARAIGRMQRQTMPFTPADGDIGAQPPMSARDVASLSTMLADAYCGLVAEAAESGVLLQPVPCAYRLVGHDGTTLYESGVEYVGAPEGIQLCEVMHPAVEKRSAKDYTIADFTLSAEAYRLEAMVPAYGSESGVAEVEIYVGEQIHPVDPAATAELRIDRADTADPSLRIALPGATVALTPCQAGLTARAAAIAGGALRWMRLAARVKAGEARTVTVSSAASGDVAESRRMTDKAVSAAEESARHALSAEERMLAAISSPHGFSADMAVRSGDTMVMTGITPSRFGGVSPLEMVVAPAGSDHIELRSVVSGAVGVIAVREATLTADFSSLRRSPLVSYPSAEATEIVITATCGDATRRFSAMLVPSTDMSRAVSLSNGIRAVDADADDASIQITDAVAPLPGRIGNLLVAAASCVSAAPSAAALLGEGVEVTDLVAADRNRSTWDSSRCHLYAAASDGIYGVSVDRAASQLTVTCLSPLLAAGPFMAADEGYYAATARGVMELKGGSVSPTEDSASWRRAAIDRNTGLKLLEDRDGTVWVVAADGTRSMADATRPEEVEWLAGTELSADERTCGAELRMRASDFHGVVEIVAGGCGRLRTICRLRIDGEIKSPLVIRSVVCPVRPYTGIRVRGKASPDFRLYSATIISRTINQPECRWMNC